MKDEVKTHFEGPGQWRSQARELEGDEKDESDDASAPTPLLE